MRNVEIVLALIGFSVIVACGKPEFAECASSGVSNLGTEPQVSHDIQYDLDKVLPQAKSGDPAAQALAAALYWHTDPKEAVDWADRAMKSGCIDGIVMLAIAFREGRGVDKDLERAFQLYLLAAQSGSRAAAGIVSDMYHKGEGIEADIDEALYWHGQSRGN
ncbi:MAG: hypothetical protein AAF465_05805 [Pseudomonadota bacterium]